MNEDRPNTTLALLQRNGISQPEFWSKRILKMIKLEKENFVFTNLGVNFDLPKNSGTTSFTVRRYNHLPIDPVSQHSLVEGVTPPPLKPQATKVTGVVVQKGAIMKITDVADEVHFDNIRTIYQPELARHAAEVIERHIIASFTDTSEYFVGVDNNTIDDITATDVVTFKDFRIVALSMKNYLRSGHSKYGGKFVAVMHTNVMQDLLDDPVLQEKLLLPGRENGPIKQGTLARYLAYDMYFTDTLICPVQQNASGINVYTSFVLGSDPYMVLSLGSKNVRFYNTGFTADKADPLAQSASVGYKLWTGAKVLDPMAITKVYSASEFDVIADFTDDVIGRPADQNTEIVFE